MIELIQTIHVFAGVFILAALMSLLMFELYGLRGSKVPPSNVRQDNPRSRIYFEVLRPHV